MLALLQLLLWRNTQHHRAVPWSFAMAFSATAIAFIELALMYAKTADEYGAFLTWSNWAVYMPPPSGNMGLLATPYMVSFDFLSIVMALGYDLVSEAVNAGCYSHQHQVIN